ncbi:MAG: hypothetical protein N2Z23_07820 [Pyrinomonadaceae bacterium]|nr:hypothetical protein [Pyrinomonadaceae bacterium]MDW8304759.1 gluconolaconase [Acidobacteriota bacterium]
MVDKEIKVSPFYAIPGAEVIITCKNFRFSYGSNYGVYFDGIRGRIIGASSNRIIVAVPDTLIYGEVELTVESENGESSSTRLHIGELLTEGMHIVANPAVSPIDGSIVITRSGARGEKLSSTLFKLNPERELEEIPVDIMNPTGLAFDKSGNLFVTNRASGEVVKIEKDGSYYTFSSNLGIATGIAFNSKGELFVGDRSGNIYKISENGESEIFANLEPSVAAYHIAFDKEDNLFVTAPSLASFDTVWKIDRRGLVEAFYRGLGRPQGIAFDEKGDLYVAACLRGRRGIVRISMEKGQAELILSGTNVVGLCFASKDEMIVATSDKVFSVHI